MKNQMGPLKRRHLTLPLKHLAFQEREKSGTPKPAKLKLQVEKRVVRPQTEELSAIKVLT